MTRFALALALSLNACATTTSVRPAAPKPHIATTTAVASNGDITEEEALRLMASMAARDDGFTVVSILPNGRSVESK